jgi:putative aldouronate transport system permease protein
MRHRPTFGSVLFDGINILFLLLLCLSFVYPIIMTLAISLSNVSQLGYKSVGFLPIGFSTESYRFLLSDASILRYYANTIIYAGLGTVIMLVCTSLMSFTLTYSEFSGRKVITILLAITMFFSGGLVPYYLLIKQLGMMNTIWVMILPGAISAWNVIIFRTFFSEIPQALKESAYMDGASYVQVLFRIILPLSKPLLATFALFSVVGYWNDFFTAVLFLRDKALHPIQMFLRRLIVLMDYQEIRNVQQGSFINVNSLISGRTVKSAAVIVTITPILCLYPFLQKYFAKGVLIGSIKG